MKSIKDTGDKYLKKLAKRSKESHVYTSYQAVGLEIAKLLEDWSHRAIYIKMAKDNDPHQLLGIAKSVAERKTVKNKGAYFMEVLEQKKLLRFSQKAKGPKQRKFRLKKK